MDFARERVNLYSKTVQYDLQVAYNNCMRNADSLIDNYERQRIINQQQINAERQEWARKMEQEKIQNDLKMREDQRVESERQQKIKKTIDNAEDLFR